MSGSLAVKVGVEGKWVDAKDAGLVAVFMNGPTFRAFRRYYNAGSPALVALDPELDDVQQLQHETFRTAPVPEADPDVPRALVHAVQAYRSSIPFEIDSGDIVKVESMKPFREDYMDYVGQYAMVDTVWQHHPGVWSFQLRFLDRVTGQLEPFAIEVRHTDAELRVVDVPWAPDGERSEVSSKGAM